MAPPAELEPASVRSRRPIHARLFAWIVVTAALLLGPSPPPPALEDWPGPLMFLAGQADKLVHAGIFGVGAHVCARSLAALGGGNPLFFGVLSSFTYGVALEGVQGTMPRRTASFGDAAADLAGGLIYVAWVRRRRSRVVSVGVVE